MSALVASRRPVDAGQLADPDVPLEDLAGVEAKAAGSALAS